MAGIKIDYKKVIYVLCFLFLCIIDQRVKTGTGLDGIIESFRDSIGIVIAVIILSHYDVRDIKHYRVPLLIWAVIGVAAGVISFFALKSRFYYANDRAVLAINIYLYGFVCILIFAKLCIEKRRFNINKMLFALWLFMFLWMNLSRSDLLWTCAYMFMFGCMILTGFSKEEEEKIFDGAAVGILMSFVLFGAFCCVFRPYDMVRFVGVYHNSNLYAEYICVVFAAFVYKLIALSRTEIYKDKRIVRIVAWAVCGIILSYGFFSISRSGMLTVACLGVFFIFFADKLVSKKKVIKNILCVILSFLIMMPVCFCVVRYVPPIFHHPIWFWGEWDENKVHSFDPWDSDKYTNIDDLMRFTVLRLVIPVNNVSVKLGLTDEVLQQSSVQQTEEEILAKYDLTPEEEHRLMKEMGAVMTIYEEYNAVNLRKVIYTHYIENLNLFGHPQSEQGIQTTVLSFVGHAHNIYLQYATDFGVPMAVMFVVLFAWCGLILFRRALGGDTISLLELLFMLIPLIFGIFEYSWGSGSVQMVLLFMVSVFAMRKE